MARDDGERTSIPWGYAHDRVAAMVVDPGRLLAYWEVTDEAIARARTRLPPEGRDAATLTLRVYDVTRLIFDGTNAHDHVDQPVERRHRQSTIDVGRPGSTAVVEIGLLAATGHFVRIARSRRADFPRHDAAPFDPPAWLTIREEDWRVGAVVPAADDGATGSSILGPFPRYDGAAPRPGGASEWPYAGAGA